VSIQVLGSNLASYPMGTGHSSAGDKATGA